MGEHDFEIGDHVEKVHGYQWPGEIRAIFTNRKGLTRVVVECTALEVSGALHIFNLDQIAKIN